MEKGHIVHRGEELPHEGMFAAHQQPFELEGVFFFPVHQFQVGTAMKESDGSKLIQLDMVTRSMLGNQVGIFLRMTPEGARELAGRLIADAQKVDEHVAAQAAAAIEKARKS